MGRYSYSQPSSSSYNSTSSSARTRRSGGCYGFPKKCHCGLAPIIETSKTPDNPGRRFYGCRNWNDGGYHLMKWCDEAMMEEFIDVKMTVGQICEEVDNIQLSHAHLKEQMIETEKRCGGIELKRFGGFVWLGVSLILVITSIWLCLRGYM